MGSFCAFLFAAIGFVKTQHTIAVGPSKNGAPIGYALKLKIVLASGEELPLGQGRDTPYEK